jgi:hypothetical protein
VASRFSASQIPRILQKLTVHHHNHNSALSIRRPEDPYLILSKWSRSLRFLHRNTVSTSSQAHTCYVPCPSHSTILGMQTVNKYFGFLEPKECDKQIFLRSCFPPLL